MSNIYLYTLSNKIRSILLTKIDKEILVNSNKNNLLINSQNQEQLMAKYVKSRDFTIESEEMFEGVRNNENNNIFYDLKYNCPRNKFTIFCYSSKKNNERLFPHCFIAKSLSQKKNNANTCLKKNKNFSITFKNLSKLKKDSGKKLNQKMKSIFSCNEIVDLKNLVSLSNDKNKHLKKFCGDFYIDYINNKNYDSQKLINYCFKLKKPNKEIISEVSDDDTSTNKGNKKYILLYHIIKNNHKSIPKNKSKKAINKKMVINKNNYINDSHILTSLTKKNSTNFTNVMKLYFGNIDKSNPKDKIKIKCSGKKIPNIELKKTDPFLGKNISYLHHHNSKSSEKNLKGKESEQAENTFFSELVNKMAHKTSKNLKTYSKTKLN